MQWRPCVQNPIRVVAVQLEFYHSKVRKVWGISEEARLNGTVVEDYSWNLFLWHALMEIVLFDMWMFPPICQICMSKVAIWIPTQRTQ